MELFSEAMVALSQVGGWLSQLGEMLSSPAGQVGTVLVIFGLTIVAFIADKVRSDIVALSSLALLLVTNVLTPSEALAGFSNSAVVMMIGLFVVGGAVFALDGVLLGAADVAFLRNASIAAAVIGFIPLVWLSLAFDVGLIGV